MPTPETPTPPTPSARYLEQLVGTFSRVAGCDLTAGLSAVGFDDRLSSNCVVYDLPDRQLLATSPERALELTARLGDARRTLDELLVDLAAFGGKRLHDGVNHVLPGGSALPDPRPGDTVRWLDIEDDADLALLAAFYDRCSEEDVEEVEIDRERPDPAICVIVDDDGSILAYASGRPFWAAAEGDDIGVLVRDDARRRGLGAAVVAEFARRRVDEAPQFYRHDLVNTGSAGVARAVGFVEVHRVHFVSFEG